MAPATIERMVCSLIPNLKWKEPSQMKNTAARKLRQVPEGYLIMGIDPHKKKHAAVSITQDFTIRDRFKFDNTREGLEFLLRRIRIEMVKSDCWGVMFVIEVGGHYWRNVAYYLDEKGIPLLALNRCLLCNFSSH